MEPDSGELKKLGATGLEYVAKGWRSHVYRTVINGRDAALKVAEPATVEKEVAILMEANKAGVGAELIGVTKHIVAMEYIKGERYTDWVGGAAPEDVKNVVLELLRQVRELDKAGIEHGQLSMAEKHIIVKEEGPYIIDFEKGSLEKKPRNLTAILNFLLLNPNGYAARTTREKLNIGADKVRRYARDYAESGDDAYAGIKRAVKAAGPGDEAKTARVQAAV